MSEADSRPGVFVTTHWTRVLASRGNAPEAREALSELCADYYGPVVAFLRSEHRDEDNARDLAHAFFAGILEHQSLAGADPARGRFRSYLLGALKHFLANQRAHALREKRGAGLEPIPLEPDTESGIPPLHPTPGAPPPPDAVFDRAWALSLLARSLTALARECADSGTLSEFETLKPWLTGEVPDQSQADAARNLGISEGAVRVTIHRLRRRYRERVKAEIARTIADPTDAADELRHLIAAVA